MKSAYKMKSLKIFVIFIKKRSENYYSTCCPPTDTFSIYKLMLHTTNK